jgi:hypothetical protein
MRFQLKDTNVFPLPGNPHMLHIATISYGLREFVGMLDRTTQKFYIEEVVLHHQDFSKDVWANFKFIDDDALAFDLAKFCEEKKVLDMKNLQERLIDEQRIRLPTSFRYTEPKDT